MSRHLECGYVLYVSGDSARPVWPLLANKNADLPPDDGLANGRPALPGATLAPEHQPRAAIRTTSSADPRIPVAALFHEIDADGNTSDGERTSNALFQLGGTDNTFLMSRRPQQMDGRTPSTKAGRPQGRWTCDDKEQLAETWYNLTATGIPVIQRPDGEDPLPYALTAAAAVQPRPLLPRPPPKGVGSQVLRCSRIRRHRALSEACHSIAGGLAVPVVGTVVSQDDCLAELDS